MRTLLNASAGGSIRKKEAEEARELIEIMAHEDEASDNVFVGRGGIMELGVHDANLAQNKLLTQQIEALTKQLRKVQVGAIQAPQLQCDFCGGNHQNGHCATNGGGSGEQVNYMGNGQICHTKATTISNLTNPPTTNNSPNPL